MSESDLKNVLIVDDTETNIDILLEILDDDYEVSVATDGESCLEFIEDELPDLILLDIMMPGMDGYEVCSRLKADKRTSHIPVVFITAKDDASDRQRGLELGALDYIAKPFDTAVVKETVKKYLLT